MEYRVLGRSGIHDRRRRRTPRRRSATWKPAGPTYSSTWTFRIPSRGPSTYDFHSVSIGAGASDIVVFGHVCRTEGEKGTRDLLDRAFAALRPDGTLILADDFCDVDRKLDQHAVLMGATMMGNTVAGNAFTGRGVHTVLVGGNVVVEDGRMTTIDESALWSAAQRAGEAITVRSGLPDQAKYPMR